MSRALPSRGKGMQLGKKSKTGNTFRDELDAAAAEAAPLVPTPTAAAAPAHAGLSSSASSHDSIHLTVNEKLSARVTREGLVEGFEVKGDLKLRVTDGSMSQVKIHLDCGDLKGAQLSTAPKVDKAVFKDDKVLRLTDASKGFPVNTTIKVMQWLLPSKTVEQSELPIKLTAWVNEDSSGSYSVTLEYEVTGGDMLENVSVSIPFAGDEPSVGSSDAHFDVEDNMLVWHIGDVAEEATGSFDFEVQASSDADLFPMDVKFTKTRPFVDIDVSQAPPSFDDTLTRCLGLFCCAVEHGTRCRIRKGSALSDRQVPSRLETTFYE